MFYAVMLSFCWIMFIATLAIHVGVGIGWPKQLRALRGGPPLMRLMFTILLAFAAGLLIWPDIISRGRFGYATGRNSQPQRERSTTSGGGPGNN